MDVNELVSHFLQGDRRAAARLMSIVEGGGDQADVVLHEIYPHRRGAHRIGITGPPGAGKSTLVEMMVSRYRRDDKQVGVVAVDPTSPFSGGALLGDRVRMSRVSTDPGVFIRSMATRGSLGGLARTTKEVVDIMDAFGKHIIIVETVGVGQSELDVASTAETTVVVLVPESGDAIQAMKAGLMEIADILVMNKADRDGADETARALEAALSLRDSGTWTPPIVKTVATEGDGIEELSAALAEHRTYLVDRGLLETRRRERTAKEIEDILRDRMWEAATARLRSSMNEHIDRTMAGEETPYSAAHSLLKEILSTDTEVEPQ